MAELEYAEDLKSSDRSDHKGSSPFAGTISNFK